MEYLNKLDKTERDDGLRVMQDMQRGKFDSIYYKQWEKKVFEVYFKKHNRIFYVVVDNKDIYLLHACDKQKNKTEKKECKNRSTTCQRTWSYVKQNIYLRIER